MPRKRVAEDLPDVAKEAIPQDVTNAGPTPTKVSATARSPKKTPGLSANSVYISLNYCLW